MKNPKRRYIYQNSPWIVIPVCAVVVIELLDAFMGIKIPYVTVGAGIIVGILVVLDTIGHLFGIDLSDDEDADIDKD